MIRQDLPQGWKWVKLKDASLIVSGSTPSSTVDRYWNGEIIWITPTDLGKLEDKYINSSGRQITQDGYNSCSTALIPKGSIVMSSRAPIGHLGIAAVPLCTNQGCKSFVPQANVDGLFLYYLLRTCIQDFQELGSGATFKEISKTTLEEYKIILPPLTEQKRMAAIIEEQMQEVETARQGILEELEAAEEMAAAYLRDVFESEVILQWEKYPLEQVCEIPPAKSVDTEGDVKVRAITTACLTEQGFDPKGIKDALMRSTDVQAAIVHPTDILIARSNTPELVGRVSMFPYGLSETVSSDLTYRLCVSEEVIPEYLTAYMSFLFLTGYWKENSGGASGTMKKITKTQLRALVIPVPDKAIQQQISNFLSSITIELNNIRFIVKQRIETIEAMPAAILHRAFSGGY